jgi:hypothetical protein
MDCKPQPEAARHPWNCAAVALSSGHGLRLGLCRHWDAIKIALTTWHNALYATPTEVGVILAA